MTRRRIAGTRRLSVWSPVHLGTDEYGRPVLVGLGERNIVLGGEPGAGKSAALNLIVAHAALSLDCQLFLVDGKQVELGLWRGCAERFIGPDIVAAIGLLRDLRSTMDSRYDLLLSHARRKVAADMGLPVLVVVFDELAYFSATIGDTKQQKEFVVLTRDLVARGRAAGVIVVAATQRPSSDIIPTSLRDLFGYRWAFRCTTDASSDVILGHGWANAGYTAASIDPAARGVGWLLAEGGVPQRMKAAYLSDSHIADLAERAEKLRADHGGPPALTGGDTAVPIDVIPNAQERRP
jgi:DNA segregation ATPase FtsK/SpoIIIE, S-DNA-T family